MSVAIKTMLHIDCVFTQEFRPFKLTKKKKIGNKIFTKSCASCCTSGWEQGDLGKYFLGGLGSN